MRYYFAFIISISILIELKAQNSNEINVLYKNALTLYEKRQTFKAIAEFEKVIRLDSNHVDALYNLAVINYQLGDQPTAIRLLRRCVKLNDKAAAKLLKETFKQKLSYADTMQNIDVRIIDMVIKSKDIRFLDLNELTSKILSISPDRKEQLQILLLWSYYNMKADSNRFFNGGPPLPTKEAFTQRIGLCDEFSNIISEFCDIANIPNFKVSGYVKYPNFDPTQKFSEANHAWNAVYLDSNWLLCDLFWSTTALVVDGSSKPHFIKRLETDYFLGHPNAFINDHLPSDPVYQFLDNPIEINAFTKSINGIDTTMKRMNYLNYQDSIKLLSQLKPEDRSLRIATHSYKFNKDNSNDFIIENFNYSVDILNKKSSTKLELKQAKSCLTTILSIIHTSNDENIRSLEGNCKDGLIIINNRLASTTK